MNESQNRRALDAVNEEGKGFLRPSIQNALGAIMVILVTTSVGVVFTVRDIAIDNSSNLKQHVSSAHAEHPVEWEQFSELKSKFETHAETGKYKHKIINGALEREREMLMEMKEFMEKGGRFTEDDGDELRKRIAKLERRMWACGCADIGVKRHVPKALK